MLNQRAALTVFVLWLTLLLTAGGCSKPSVSGHVEVEGSAVASGHIQFIPEGESEGESFTAEIRDGDFLVRKQDIAGSYKVVVNIDFVDSESAAEFYNQLMADGGPNKTAGAEKPQSHVFLEELKNGKNVLNYDLEKDGSPP